MQIAIHLGAHCTEDDLLLGTLADNADRLARHGVSIPAKSQVWPSIRSVFQGGGGNLVAELDHAPVQDLILRDSATRTVLSYEGALGIYLKALSGRSIYRRAGKRAALLRDAFAGDEVEFFLAIRNPATFVPALFEASPATAFDAFAGGCEVSRMNWSDTIDRIRAACPEVPLTVWCNEDLPLIWPDVLRRVAGVDAELAGEDAILRRVMTPEGIARLEGYLRDHPTQDRATWRKVVTAFLAKYADDAAVAPEIALPGWSEETIAELSTLYARDVHRIRAMDDLTFIAP